jgi:RNA polymerase sigma factor (sigma-70 family)
LADTRVGDAEAVPDESMPVAQKNQSTVIRACLDQLRKGDDSARSALLECACERLTRLARKMLKSFPQVHRWEETDDVLQNALMRLQRALETTAPVSVRSFVNLAAVQIRRELIDLARHYDGPNGMGAHHESQDLTNGSRQSPPERIAAADTNDPERFEAWARFHRGVESLNDEDREVFDLLWYQGLTQGEAAEVLGLSEKTVNRRWVAARMRLGMALGGQLPF